MGCAKSLLRTFPAHAVAIPTSIFQDPRFRLELALTLEKLDAEVIDEAVPNARKAGAKVTEIRDTPDPKLVTEMFMATLAAVGRPAKVRQIQKRTRDDVLWDECLLPWRRSPLWLSVRVAIQTTLTYTLPNDEANATLLYKNFIAFLMTEVASLASGADLPNYLCLIINAKVARRIFKLGAGAANFIPGEALSISKATRKAEEKIWSALQVQDAERAATVAEDSTFQSDTSLTLRSSSDYLNSVLTADQEARSPPSFEPHHRVWMSKTNGGLPRADCFNAAGEELIYALAEFESWVSESLPSWVSEAFNTLHDNDCLAVASLAKEYHFRASSAYKDTPELNSILILTLAELWQAVDLLATRIIPLLNDFAPEVPLDFFHPILAPQWEQMQRLTKVEAYIAGREQKAKTCNPGIFDDQKEQSFAVQFSESSPEHKALRRKIEEEASDLDIQKKEEHELKEKKFRQMQQDVKNLPCQFKTDNRGLEWHDGDCRKCELERLMANVSIEVYEWPLPPSEAACISAVFELDCPTSFAAWRNVTWIVLNDLGRPPVTSPDNPAANLFEYAGLQSYATRKISRLIFASKTKSFTKAHYKAVKFPVSVDKCTAPNALEYQLFDSEKSVWVHTQATTMPNVQRLCNTSLPEGPYSNLQFAVDSTLHKQNQVIADQETCSRELSLHEFIAFGSLRADGECVQWLNIKRELSASNLKLNTEAVCTLVSQAAWQAGSKAAGESKHYRLRSGGSAGKNHGGTLSGTAPEQKLILRLSHHDFFDLSFCKELLSTISSNLDSMGSNWDSDHALSLLIIITLRTLTLSAEAVIISSAITILHRMREVAERWVQDLVELLHQAHEDEQISKLQRRVLRATMLCRMSYNVDKKYIPEVLRTTEDLRCWIMCSVRLRENTPGDSTTLPPELRRRMLRDQRLSHSLYQAINHLILHGSNVGLNQAVGQMLTDFESRATLWTSLTYPQHRWLHMKTQASAVHSSQVVYYNILEGEIFVDGMPLGRLPKEYLCSDIYRRIFGAKILHVFSADMPGMRFMVAGRVHGYKVYFGMRDGRIVIRTGREQELLELIPNGHFNGDLPDSFVNDYTHWLDLSSKEIEFRPLNLLWLSSPRNWRLEYHLHGPWCLSKGERRLVDMRSSTSAAVMEVFKSLEVAEFVHVMLFKDIELHVFLPRLKLNFFLNATGDMECRELRRIVDCDQALGTLIGLKSRLVLCGLGDLAKKHDRIVIIPYGEPTVVKSGAHVEVKITTRGRNVSFFSYRHDAELQRLCGDGKMSSTLYKAYLHALTSYIYPDPFTGCTGTDEALTSLHEQLTKCSEPLEEEATKLITLVSEVTPRRGYYPKHLKVMQQVRWHPMLSPLAQHDEFFHIAEQIVVAANRFSIFYPDGKTSSLKSSSDRTLLQRAKARNSAYRSSDFGGNHIPPDGDVDYEARDRSNMTERSLKVYTISSLIVAWPLRLEVSADINADILPWSTMLGFGKAYSSSRSLSEILDISFASSWGSLQALCSHSSRDDKYNLLFIFAVIAYSQKAFNLNILTTLLAFAFVPDLKKLKPPAYQSFTLDIGCAPRKTALQEILRNEILPFRASSGSLKSERRQQKIAYNVKAAEQVSTLTRHYKCQWPRSKPDAPTAGLASFIDVKQANSKISDLFFECEKNVKLTAFLQEAQAILIKVQQISALSEDLPSQWHQSERIPVLLQDRNCTLPTLQSLMDANGPPESMPLFGVSAVERPSVQASKSRRLHSVIGASRLNSGNLGHDSIRRLYGEDLKASLDAYQNHQEYSAPNDIPQSITMTLFHRIMVQHHVDEVSKQIRGRLLPTSQLSDLLELAGLWPRLTLRSLLKLLSQTSACAISTSWQHYLLALGEAVTMLQRARRLVLAGERLDVSTFFDEIGNVGRQGWRSSDLPDWLLIEIENDFLIRPIQARVALEMIQPISSANSLIQLNMGEGKSSVIIPLAAVALANGTRMVRTVVLKSLSKQMSQTMNRRLGGLVNRKIYYMPFSRRTVVDERVIRQIGKMQEECMSSKGVLLAQPEHILSFKLMGVEKLASGHYKLASQLLASQKWLEENSRDILDESDEILDVRFQLVYTLGTQRMMDGQPDRWQLTQEIFDLVDKHASALQRSTNDQLELERRSPSSFPTVRLLSTGVGDILMYRLAHDVVDGQLPGLNLSHCHFGVKEAILRFIQEYHVEADCLAIKASFASEQTIMQKLLLIRGLIAYKILLFVLRGKRWSVNYGLHPTRCLSAVPYRAKGVPAPNAEFGHPDVAIALTCLTYYYSGLTDPQIRICFELLQKSDDPSVEYAKWTKRSTSIADSLRNWSSVNLENDRQCHDEIFPALRFSKKLADYFLNSIVFPQEGKQFDEKLSTSGWDIPSRSGADNLTTGFSGTNDNRFLLPMTISQQDLPELQHTSGKVLDYVARPENLKYYYARDGKGQQMSAEHLLRFITNIEPNIRVLIDVGAQVLDKSNEDVVKDWMQLVPNVDAGVYFDVEDNIMVLPRDLEAERLATSSFQSRMDRCVVYLDEVHTRGTDLKLPNDARAAVTLGPRLTKDKLVQGMQISNADQGDFLS